MHVGRADVLGTETATDDQRRNELQRPSPDKLRDGNLREVTGQVFLDRFVLHEDLAGLDDPGGQLAAALNLRQVGSGQMSGAQWAVEDVGRGHRIGHGQIDADAAGRRHGVRGVTDTEQTLAPPRLESIHPHVELAGVIPGLQVVDVLEPIAAALTPTAS